MYFLRKKEIPLTAFFTPAYVDIHSHLLPGIDDGAKNMEDTIALLLKMRSYGMHHFITTPHVMGSFGSGSKNYQVFFLHCSTYISVQINSCFDRKKRIAVTEASLKAASCIPKIYLPFRSASNT